MAMTDDAFRVLVANGISASDFWEMTWGEAYLVMQGIQERINEAARVQAFMAYKTADLTIEGIAGMFIKGGNRRESLREAFPGLFDAVETEVSWEVMRDRFNEAFPKPKKKG